MSQGKHGIKILGLSLLATLGLMAVIGAAAAQAGEYRLNGLTFTADGTAQTIILGTVGGGTLLTAIGLEIRCESGTIEGTVLLGGGAHIKVLFNGCTIWAGGIQDKNCLLFETRLNDEMGELSGHIVALGLGELILHRNAANTIREHYLEVDSALSNPPEPLATIWIGNHIGKKLCTLPLENVVTGTAAFYLETALEERLTQTAKTLTAAQTELLNLNAKKEGLNRNLQLSLGGEAADLAPGTTAEVRLENDNVWGME